MIRVPSPGIPRDGVHLLAQELMDAKATEGQGPSSMNGARAGLTYANGYGELDWDAGAVSSIRPRDKA